MNFVKKISSSVLLKFTIGILGILVVSLLLFLWYIHSSENKMFNTIYQTRREQVEIETEKNIKTAAQNRLELIKLQVERQKRELGKALFMVDKEKCQEIVSDFASFPSVKGVELFDLLVNDHFFSDMKDADGRMLSTKNFSNLQQLPQLYLELFYEEVSQPVGYLKIFYDVAVFTEDARTLGKEAIQALDAEVELARKTINSNFTVQILGLILIFTILYVAIYIFFSNLINRPLKDLEDNLRGFFNFLINKDDSVEICEIKANDEFGRMGKFINNGIGASIKIQQELAKLATVLEQSAQAIMITDIQGNIEYVNAAFEQITGYSFAEVRGKKPSFLKSGQYPDTFYRKLWETITSGKVWQSVLANKKKDGSIYYERAIIFPVKGQNGEIINYAAAKQDITKERMLEHQLSQAQKMESIGTLAGGIAHDFNNLLTVINGFGELTLLDLDPDDPVCENINAVIEAGKRAQILTSQLLAFSRKQVYQPEIIEINEVISSMDKMMRRLIGEDIVIKSSLAEKLPRIQADVSQLEQIFVNLVVNARDALNTENRKEGGKRITIQTGEFFIDSEYISQHLGSCEGRHVFFAVSDNGVGMDEETRQKIFEPFFTTKEKHRGTGLGLSMVYGVVKQNNGFIYVYSEPGSGTTFKIYWPVSDEQEKASMDRISSSEFLTGSERILVVEDEQEVRRFAKASLNYLGYKVYTAINGRAALDLLQQGLKVDLIITDLIMPEMNGREFIEKAVGFCSEEMVIYVSGYMDDHIAQNCMLDAKMNFVAKPYSMHQLSAMVREVLDGKK
jgi:PAS domain S-box-containing protein